MEHIVARHTKPTDLGGNRIYSPCWSIVTCNKRTMWMPTSMRYDGVRVHDSRKVPDIMNLQLAQALRFVAAFWKDWILPIYGHLDKQPPCSRWREGLSPWSARG